MPRVDNILKESVQEAGKVYKVTVNGGPRNGLTKVGDKDAIIDFFVTDLDPNDTITVFDNATGRKLNSGKADWFRNKFDKLFV